MSTATEAEVSTMMTNVTETVQTVLGLTKTLNLADNGAGYVVHTLQQLNDAEFKQRLIPVVYLCILMVLGIPGNLLVLFIYLRFYKKCTAHRTFILCLAAIDIAVCTISLPFEIIEMRYQYKFYAETVCKIFRTNNNFLAFLSMFVLLCLSIDRFRLVCVPLKRQITPHMARLISVGALVLALLFSWPKLFLSGTRHVLLGNGTITGFDCSFSDVYAKTIYPKIYIGLYILVSLSVIVTLILLYCVIGRKVRSLGQFRRRYKSPHPCTSNSTATSPNDGIQSANITNGQNDQVSETKITQETGEAFSKDTALPESSKSTVSTGSSKKANKVTKIAFVLSLVFILSYLPFFILTLITVVKEEFVAKPAPVVIATLPIISRTVFINNIANPFIYWAFDCNFRQSVKLCCCIFRRK